MLFILASLVACSGGGGGGGGGAPVQSTKAVLTLSTSGTLPAGSAISGIEVEIDLPAGVTTKASITTPNPSIMETDNGVVTASGAAAGADFVHGAYTTGATSNTHKVTVSVGTTSASGFTTGNFATVNCDIAAGSFPVSSDFHLANFTAVDLNSVPIGLTVGYTVVFQ